jgi:hypothetical protein
VIKIPEQFSNGRRVRHKQGFTPIAQNTNAIIALRKPFVSRRMEMNVDVEELQMFDGIAACANHTINFRIGKFLGSKDILKLLNRIQIYLAYFNFDFKLE